MYSCSYRIEKRVSWTLNTTQSVVRNTMTCLRHVRWAESPLRYKGIRGRLIQRDESGVGGVHEVDGRRHEEDVSNVGGLRFRM